MKKAKVARAVSKSVQDVATLVSSRQDLARFEDNAGLLFALQVRFLLEDIETIADSALTDGGNDKKCDLVYIDATRNLAVVAQGYWSKKLNSTEAPSNKASDLNTALSWLLNSPLKELKEPLRSAAQELRSAIKSDVLKTIEIWFAHNLPSSQNVQCELRQVEETTRAHLAEYKTKEPIQVRAIEVGAEKLLDWYLETQNPLQVLDEVVVTIKDGFELSSKDWSAFITHVPASWLWTLFRTYGEKLFSANVRGYLGSRKADANINNGIKTTVLQEPSQFWVYNNGLTALVNEYETGKKRGGQMKLKLSGLSIVNGAQTTGAIGALTEEPSDEALVQARFVKCVDPKIIDDVIRFNNSQNRIEASDFRSNDSIQKRLRDEFDKLPDVTYLGGRRGGADDFIKRTANLIPSDAVAQALCAFHGQPERAYNRKSDLWKNDGYYNDIFNDSTSARHIIFSYSLLRAIQAYHQELKAEERRDKLTDQMTKRLNFLSMRGATFLLMSAIAKSLEVVMAQKITNLFRLNFNAQTSPKKAESKWKPLLLVLAPFTPVLSVGVEGGFKARDQLEVVISNFIAPVEATRDQLSGTFESFSKQVELR